MFRFGRVKLFCQPKLNNKKHPYFDGFTIIILTISQVKPISIQQNVSRPALKRFEILDLR
jgi:hypothetical protein